MYTLLFPDDRWLFGRKGTRRAYGVPERIGSYTDPDFSHDYGFTRVFPVEDGYRMLYFGSRRKDGKRAILAARSEDGIHFTPFDTGDVGGEKLADNHVLPLPGSREPADVIEDINAPDWDRYKMIMTEIDGQDLQCFGYVLASPDLIHWHEYCRPFPGWLCEPISGIFYNHVQKCYTISRRRVWGDRSVGYTDTLDFRTQTPFQLAIHQDGLDEALDEVYGMPVFPYKGNFIGFPLLYSANAASRGAKFNPGNIYPQLAWSEDGHHWMRSLRTSFLPEYKGQDSLFWLSSFMSREDGSVLMYCPHTEQAHGVAFREHSIGRVEIYRLREDGFWGLYSTDDEEAVVTTREMLYMGGPIRVNITAENATCAVLSTNETDRDGNPLAEAQVVPGFDHKDCRPFSGDSTAWEPVFSGADLSRFIGKTIVVEVRYRKGVLYSVSGSLRPLLNTEAARYRVTGRLPE